MTIIVKFFLTTQFAFDYVILDVIIIIVIVNSTLDYSACQEDIHLLHFHLIILAVYIKHRHKEKSGQRFRLSRLPFFSSKFRNL